MSDQSLNLLIVEPEPLIGIDIERIVSEAFACRTTLVTALAETADAWDVVICDCPELTVEFMDRMKRLMEQGTSIVLVSASEVVVRSPSPWRHIAKPFVNGDLIEAVRDTIAALRG
ncbi:hypothetical protein CSC94_02850 [Zhengella mangrovi]|uniref:Response regulatory domain-containing protein n=1 Tax=Zhengella mangrovi TaxID=1982044 RepID=A0A2G1QTY6_9HYPH|nr:hypothetical protein [Zhengella mangrovi]PHP68941.1 hypothetical protein CSC94_02850 [Zhengella mangrovi]